MILYNFQRKIHDLLKGNKDIKWGIYDYVPEVKRMPFIIIGEDFASPWNTKTWIGKQITTTINFWSDQRSMLEMKKMIGLVEDTLSIDFEIGGFEYEHHETGDIEVKRETEELIRGTIKLTYHGTKEV
ncbi:MAG: DUF3168 domain-containing protein [Bacillaceae bacterium]|nr:DUF3168 domain-containing protein [Bacillaceae bacterium]